MGLRVSGVILLYLRFDFATKKMGNKNPSLNPDSYWDKKGSLVSANLPAAGRQITTEEPARARNHA